MSILPDEHTPILNEDGNGGKRVSGVTPGRPDPDPLSELATIDDSGRGGKADPPKLAEQPGNKPGFGPSGFSRPTLEGNPELGIDPREAAARTSDGA